MAAYRDRKSGKWTVKFSYKDWTGNRRWTSKRGFATKKAAMEYEQEYRRIKSENPDMKFAEFVEKYRSDYYPRIKISTQATKDNVIDTHILPYFGRKKLNEIFTRDILAWQNEILKCRDKTGKKLSKSYIKTIHNQMSAILNYAVKFYGLRQNVAAAVGNMGTDKETEAAFWTKEDYLKFAEESWKYPEYYYAFEVLYWTGIREGELLALTPDDIDFEKKTISITKTYQVVKKEELITEPKTQKSIRIVKIPAFLVEELTEYMLRLYDIKQKDRLFLLSKSNLNRYLKKIAAEANVKPIRVHDLRHSHVSLLIEMGYNAVAIGERVGHSSATITYRYAHMFPGVQNDMADRLNEMGSLNNRHK